MEKKLEDMTVAELKVLAYDTIGLLELYQRNLQVINTEIGKRANPLPEATKENKPPLPKKATPSS